MSDEYDPVDDFDHEAETFDEWFRRNEDLCHEMLRSDAYELLYQAWFGGYSHGLKSMAEFFRPVLPKFSVDNRDTLPHNGGEETKD